MRVGGLAYASNDTLSEVAITDIMGPRLSAARALGRNISIVRATSLLGGCAVVAGCSMIMAWLQTRFSTGAPSSGSSAWKVANWQTRPQQIAFDRRVILVDRGDVRGPERRLSVADQFGSDRLHDLDRIVEPVVTVGSSMLIALQAGVG